MSAIWVGAGILFIIAIAVALYTQQRGSAPYPDASVERNIQDKTPESDTIEDVAEGLPSEPGNRG